MYSIYDIVVEVYPSFGPKFTDTAFAKLHTFHKGSNSSSLKCWRKCRNVCRKSIFDILDIEVEAVGIVIPSRYGLHWIHVYETKKDYNPCKDFGIIVSKCISDVATERSTVFCVFCAFIQASFQTHEGQKTWKTCIEISHHQTYQDASSSKSSSAFCISTCTFDSRIWAKKRIASSSQWLTYVNISWIFQHPI